MNAIQLVVQQNPYISAMPAECPHNQVWSDCVTCWNYCGLPTLCTGGCSAQCACPPDLPYQTEENGICVATCPEGKKHAHKIHVRKCDVMIVLGLN